jgi:formaldehyde-activating enzyme involved in methanogenesis
MGEDESILLALYGIKTESKLFYFYKQYRYESAKDAINCAMLDAERTQKVIKQPEKLK